MVALGIPKIGGSVPHITRPGPGGEKHTFTPEGGGGGAVRILADSWLIS